MAECRTRVGQWLTAGVLVALFAPACGEMSFDESALEDGGAGAATPDGGSGGSGGSSGFGGSGGGGMGGTGAISAGSAGDAGGGAESGFTASPTTFLIHNAPDTFPVRICLKVDGKITGYPYPGDFGDPMPLSNYPGIPVGGAWNIDELLKDIDPASDVTFHLVSADAQFVIDEKSSCEKVLKELKSEFVLAFESVNINLLTQETVRSLVLEGCKPGSNLTEAQCGEDFTVAEGNLALRSIGVSPAVTYEPATHVYPMHLSPSLAEYPAEATFPLMYGDLDGGDNTLIEADVPRNLPNNKGTAFTPPNEPSGFGKHGFTLEKRDPASPAPEILLKASLAHIQRVTSPNDTPDAFFAGANGFVLVFLGDVAASQPWLDDQLNWNTKYDGQGFHVLALPFQFTLAEEPR